MYVSRYANVRRLLSGACLAAIVAIAGSLPATAGTISAAAANHAATTSPVKIVYVNPLTATPDWGRSSTYLLNAQKTYGYSASVVGPTNTLDIPTMVSDIQEAIADHAQVIITCGCATGAFNHVFSLARKAGIVVVTIGADSPGSNLFFGTNYTVYGESAAKELIAKMHGVANIGIVSSNGTIQNQVQEIDAFKATISKYPGMKILDSVYDQSEASLASTQMSEMLAAFPSINVIWTVEGAAPGAVPSVLRQAGKKPGQITVLAVDLQATTPCRNRAGLDLGHRLPAFLRRSPPLSRVRD